MPLAIELFFFLAALAGHTVLWVGFVNRVHGVNLPRWLIDGLTMASGAALCGAPLVAAASYFAGELTPPFAQNGEAGWLTRYAEACLLLLPIAVAIRTAWAIHRRLHPVILGASSTTLDLGKELGDDLVMPGVPRLLSRLPGNETLRLELAEKELLVPQLPPALDGLRIAHLSDLHMSGRIGVDYFRAAVRAANEAAPDLIAVTGDLVEHNPQLDWVDSTLAKLIAPEGVYFVLGNHDRHVDHGRLREMLTAAGMIDLGGRAIERTLRGARVRLVGNELPWFTPAGDPHGDGSAVDFTLGLAHGPDQFGWAAQSDIGLLLAGHNHGGQIQFPLVGPIVAPSITGTRYAGGAFRRGDSVMHVSRGTGSLAPLRFRCPPEVAILTLRGKE